MRKIDISEYPGSKNVPVFKPLLFNVLPVLNTFVDCFTGSGFVASTVEKYADKVLCYESYEPIRMQLMKRFSKSVDKIKLPAGGFNLSMVDQNNHRSINSHGTTVYFMDPPYMFSTRLSENSLYGHEWSNADHVEYLTMLAAKFCFKENRVDNFVILTHPRCETYEQHLNKWFTVDFTYATRRRVIKDTMWMNYDPSNVKLACTDYIGENHTKRQAVTRRLKSLKCKYEKLSKHEKQKFLGMINVK